MPDTTLEWMADKAATKRDAKRAKAQLRALRHVESGNIEWRDQLGKSRHAQGGFTGVGGAPLNRDVDVLCALWELLRDVLICLDGEAVKLTLAGERQLAEWERGGSRG